MGFEFLKVQHAFPDLLLERNGIVYRAELEYEASSFHKHGHDIRQCDLIICWINDLPNCVLPILELSNPSWSNTYLFVCSEARKRDAFVKREADMIKKQEAQILSGKLIPTESGNGLPPVKSAVSRTRNRSSRSRRNQSRIRQRKKQKLKATEYVRQEDAGFVDKRSLSGNVSHSITRTEPDMYFYGKTDGSVIRLHMPCARVKRGEGETLEVIGPAEQGECEDCRLDKLYKR